MTNEDMGAATASENIDLRRYLYLFLQWAWLFALVAVIAAGGAYFVNSNTTPVYQATTKLLVSDPMVSRAGVLTGDAMVSSYDAATTYVQMITDRRVLEQVIAELKLPFSPEALRGAIGVNLVNNTRIIMLTVEDTNKERAANIANTMGLVFPRRIQELQGARYSVSKENLQKQLSAMEDQIDQTTQEKVATTDTAERDRLETKLTQYRVIYSNLVTSYEQVRLAEAQTNTTVVQTDPAVVPAVPVRPRTMQNTLLAGLIGALLAAGSVVVVDALDDRLKDPTDLARRTGLTVIGVIPFTATEATGPVTSLEPRSPVSEAYRALRTNIQFSNVARKLNRIVVTSPTPGDGKTTIAANLAIILAQGGQKVTLIDADLRRPKVHKMFKLTNRAGLTGLFLKQIELSDAAKPAGMENLSIITSGQIPPNPAELLGSTRMSEMLDEIQTTSDKIVVDTPPILSVTDASVLNPYVDGVILVVQVGQTHVGAALQAVNNMRQVGVNLIGLVINGVKFDNSRYSYYYRSRYYSSYYYYSQSYGADGKSGKRSKKINGKRQIDSPEETEAAEG
jgi:non-specific protein-tyrosine kinase